MHLSPKQTCTTLAQSYAGNLKEDLPSSVTGYSCSMAQYQELWKDEIEKRESATDAGVEE